MRHSLRQFAKMKSNKHLPKHKHEQESFLPADSMYKLTPLFKKPGHIQTGETRNKNRRPFMEPLNKPSVERVAGSLRCQARSEGNGHSRPRLSCIPSRKATVAPAWDLFSGSLACYSKQE